MAKRSKKSKTAPKMDVPINGMEAHAKGFTAADCPYEEDDAEFQRWNDEFDMAADKQTEEEVAEEAEAPEEEARSVVKEEYRARYAEAGHPAHCGDELAILLNNLCLTKSHGIDLPRFEAICAANGVDLTKYNRTTNGWQGRLRMTGRNILASKVFAAGGVMKAGIEGAEAEYRMSPEWMASRRKTKAPAPSAVALPATVKTDEEAPATATE